MMLQHVRAAFAMVAFVLGASALPAAADIPVGGATVNDVSALIQDLGYTTTLGTDSTGDPIVKFAMVNTNVEIWFYDCDAVKRCQSIQLVAGFALSLESPQQVLSYYVTSWIYKLPADYWDKYPQRVMGVTAAQVQTAARKYLDPARMQIIAVGDGKKVEEILRKFGKLEVYERRGLKLKLAAEGVKIALKK